MVREVPDVIDHKERGGKVIRFKARIKIDIFHYQ